MHELTCPFPDCGNVTSHDNDNLAITIFNAHIGTHTVGSQQRQQGKPNKIETPKLRSRIGPDKFNFWLERWENYKRVNRLREVQDIRDQLVNYFETELYCNLHNTFGTSLQLKAEEELTTEMWGLAVPHHSNLVSVVALRSATQGEDALLCSETTRTSGGAKALSKLY